MVSVAAGGTYAATKIASAYEEHIANKRKINQKDMYFYYKAGKLLEK